MELLVDTHVLLWWLANAPQLSSVMRDALAEPTNRVFVSTASAWEISIKRGLGKLAAAPDDLVEAVEATGFEWLAISAQHAVLAGALPRYHNDPFDRMLVAQATVERLTVVTVDDQITRYGVSELGR